VGASELEAISFSTSLGTIGVMSDVNCVKYDS